MAKTTRYKDPLKDYEVFPDKDGIGRLVPKAKKNNLRLPYFESWAKINLKLNDKKFKIEQSLFQRKKDELLLPIFLEDLKILIQYITETFDPGTEPLILEPITGQFQTYEHLKYTEEKVIKGFFTIKKDYVIYFSKPPDNDELEIALTKKPIYHLINALQCKGNRDDVNLTDALEAIRKIAKQKSNKLPTPKNKDMNQEHNLNKFLFWIFSDDRNIIIVRYMLLDILHKNGFYTNSAKRSEILRVINNVVSVSSRTDIKSFILDKINNLPPVIKEYSFGKDITREDLKEVLLKGLSTYLSTEILSTLPSIPVEVYKDSLDKCSLPYLNVVIEVTKDGARAVEYEDLSAPILDKQIIQRKFIESNSSNLQDCEFYKFCYNLANKDDLRMKSLMSIIGYLIHTYKDPSQAFIIIFTDTEISENGEARGGVGKTILGTGISKMRFTTHFDGRIHKINSRFGLQNIEPHSQIYLLEDVGPDFVIDHLIQMSTGVIPIEKKFHALQTLSFKESGKYLITSNYIPLGSGGNSEERRKIVFEVSNHYNKDWTPFMDFGHRLFDEWDEEEWARFDRFMIECARLYLAEGLIRPDQINIKEKTVVQKTNIDFYSYFHSKIQAGQKTFFKAEELEEFKRSFPDYKSITQRMFTSWIFHYLESYNLKFKQEPIDTRKQIVLI